MCLQDTCPKLFQVIQPPPPQSSATPGKKRAAKPVTRETVLRERATQWKRTRAAKRLLEPESNGGVKIRGRWISSGVYSTSIFLLILCLNTRILAAPVEKRQSQNLGPAMDGSFGVDSQDVLAIPQIGFSTLWAQSNWSYSYLLIITSIANYSLTRTPTLPLTLALRHSKTWFRVV